MFAVSWRRSDGSRRAWDEYSIRARLDIGFGAFQRGRDIGVLIEPVGVDSRVDEDVRRTLLDRSHFGGMDPRVNQFLVRAVLDVDAGHIKIRYMPGHHVGIIVVTVLDIGGDVGRQGP
jgi:hypothetical protein